MKELLSDISGTLFPMTCVMCSSIIFSKMEKSEHRFFFVNKIDKMNS